MRNYFFLSGALSVVFLLSWSGTAVYADDAAENIAVEQTEEQTEPDDATDDTVAVPDSPSDEAESHDSQAESPTDEAKTDDDSKPEPSAEETTNEPETPASEAQSEDASLSESPSEKAASVAEATPKPLVIDGLVLTDAERRVFELTNAERQKRGLPALRLDRRLMESARRQANWMARTGIFRHGNSGFAENIAMGQRSSLAVVVAWLNSAGHFRNMMNRSHGAIGIGSYRGKNGALFWCQQFSR
ncbi:MAG: CAP domain-containing protein [Planctomycetaceae bacterium]|nr:CAP domain-containing protein [Planctomycetaceae bacterium]